MLMKTEMIGHFWVTIAFISVKKDIVTVGSVSGTIYSNPRRKNKPLGTHHTNDLPVLHSIILTFTRTTTRLITNDDEVIKIDHHLILNIIKKCLRQFTTKKQHFKYS